MLGVSKTLPPIKKIKIQVGLAGRWRWQKAGQGRGGGCRKAGQGRGGGCRKAGQKAGQRPDWWKGRWGE